MGANKSIIICSDGTGNQSNKGRGTNVFKIFEAIDNSGHHQGQNLERQIAYYDDGVGTSNFAPIKIIGGAFGFGVARNVRQLYRQLCRSYKPGDKIYMFGFSRGAYTVRTLASIVIECGLVDMHSNKKIKYLGFLKPGSTLWLNWISWRAWRAHRRRFKSVLGYLFELISAGKSKNATTKFRKTYSVDRDKDEGQIRIHFLGVWDTVAAVGLPFDLLTWFVNLFIYRFSFPNQELNSRVEKACQALAIDEERASFKPILWRETDGDELDAKPGIKKTLTKWWDDVLMKNKKPSSSVNYNRAQACTCYQVNSNRTDDISAQQDTENQTTNDTADPRIEQVWFPGVHSDIGGGYPKQGLSYVVLDWMMEKANASGLRFSKGARDTVRAQRNAFDKLHNSRAGTGTVYRYYPRNIARLCYENHAKQRIHAVAFERICDDSEYRPSPISNTAQVVKTPHEQFWDIDPPQQQVRKAVSPYGHGFLVGSRVTLHWVLIGVACWVVYLAQIQSGGLMNLAEGLYNSWDSPIEAMKIYFYVPLAADDFYWGKRVFGSLLGLFMISTLVQTLLAGVQARFWSDIFK